MRVVVIKALPLNQAIEKVPTSKIQQLRRSLSEWDVENAVPYNSKNTANSEHGRTMFAPTVVRESSPCRKIATLFADFTLCYGIKQSGAEVFAPTPLCFNHYFVFLFLLFLHRLVGLRLLRLCLKLRSGLCHSSLLT